MKRYEYHFMSNVFIDKAREPAHRIVEWSDSLKVGRMMYAVKVIDHMEGEILKNKEGRTGRIYQG